MTGLDIDAIRAEFTGTEGSGRERAQVELIHRLCDEVERLWGEVQWQELRGAVVGGMMSGLVAHQSDDPHALGDEVLQPDGPGAGARRRVRVVEDLSAADLGRHIEVGGEDVGDLRGLSAAKTASGEPGQGLVHISTDRREMDCPPQASCRILGSEVPEGS